MKYTYILILILSSYCMSSAQPIESAEIQNNDNRSEITRPSWNPNEQYEQKKKRFFTNRSSLTPTKREGYNSSGGFSTVIPFSPPPPPPPNGGSSTIPIDGGVSFLLAAGAGYGLTRLRKKKPHQDFQK